MKKEIEILNSFYNKIEYNYFIDANINFENIKIEIKKSNVTIIYKKIFIVNINKWNITFEKENIKNLKLLIDELERNINEYLYLYSMEKEKKLKNIREVIPNIKNKLTALTNELAFDMTKDQLYEEGELDTDELNNMEIDSIYSEVFHERYIMWYSYFQDKILKHLNVNIDEKD